MLQSVLDKRVLLISGKGGVGRTSVAAAAARAAALAGRRVLLVEIGDPDGGGSPLAAVFGLEGFAPEPIDLGDGLRACHLWAPKGHELFLRSILPGGVLIGAAMRSKALQTFLNAAPSFLEMGWFFHLLTLVRTTRHDGSPEHELIVVDMPATGHTLALTGLPGILHRLITAGPIPAALREGEAIINDPATASAWVVTLPETLPVAEAIELVEGLRETKVPVGGVVLNRVPDDPFTPEEHTQIAALLAGKKVLGALGFQRIRRSHEALRKLIATVELPVLEVADMPLEGDALFTALVDALQGRASAPEAA